MPEIAVRELTTDDPVSGVAARPAPGTPVDAMGVGYRQRYSTHGGRAGRHRLGRLSARQAGALPDRTIAGGRAAWLDPDSPGPDAVDPALAKPGDRLACRSPGVPANAEKVHLRPAFHLSHNLGHRLADRMREDSTVVWRGASLFGSIFGGGGGVVVRVDRVEPDGLDRAVVGLDTEVVFEEPDPEVGRRRMTFAEIGGLDEAIERLRDLVELPLLRPGLYRAPGRPAPEGCPAARPAGHWQNPVVARRGRRSWGSTW